MLQSFNLRIIRTLGDRGFVLRSRRLNLPPREEGKFKSGVNLQGLVMSIMFLDRRHKGL